jgi:acetyl esterase/lipase
LPAAAPEQREAGGPFGNGSPDLSLRAELVRLGLRWFVKRRGPALTAIDAMRQQSAKLARLVPLPPRGTEVRRLELDGIKAVTVTTPETSGGRHVLYLHGGGHVSGSPGLYRDFIWRIASATHSRVTILRHRLAPEHPFPAALDDAVSAYRALLAEGVDPRQMAMMGDSAGGGLVLGTLLKLRDQGIALPAAAVALSPWTDLALTGQSLRFNADLDPMIRTEEAPALVSHYLAGADPRTPYASPLYGDHTGLPPTLIQVGSEEVLLDDSVRMAERMRAAGCEVELQVWPRLPHVWQVWARLMPEAREAIAHIGTFVRGRMQG